MPNGVRDCGAQWVRGHFPVKQHGLLSSCLAMVSLVLPLQRRPPSRCLSALHAWVIVVVVASYRPNVCEWLIHPVAWLVCKWRHAPTKSHPYLVSAKYLTSYRLCTILIKAGRTTLSKLEGSTIWVVQGHRPRDNGSIVPPIGGTMNPLSEGHTPWLTTMGQWKTVLPI